MPAIKVITPIMGGRYYHLFNRGNNGQQVFFTEENYKYFLRQFYQFLTPFVDLLAYSLMPNHFHFLIRTKDSIPSIGYKDSISFKKMESLSLTDESEIGKIVSNQFRRFFITYSMAINKQENHTGSLFSKNFKRFEIEDEDYLKYVAFYIHFNPEKHGWIEDFRNYKLSSWKAYNSTKLSALNRELLLEFYGGQNEFLDYHEHFHEERELNLLE
jgi:putative transposase